MEQLILHTRQFLDMAKTSKLQAADESNAHVDKFETMVATQRASLADVLDTEMGRMYVLPSH